MTVDVGPKVDHTGMGVIANAGAAREAAMARTRVRSKVEKMILRMGASLGAWIWVEKGLLVVLGGQQT